MVDWMVSWGTPLFVTYDELHSPNYSPFHILMFTTRGQSEPQQYIQSPWKAFMYSTNFRISKKYQKI